MLFLHHSPFTTHPSHFTTHTSPFTIHHSPLTYSSTAAFLLYPLVWGYSVVIIRWRNGRLVGWLVAFVHAIMVYTRWRSRCFVGFFCRTELTRRVSEHTTHPSPFSFFLSFTVVQNFVGFFFSCAGLHNSNDLGMGARICFNFLLFVVVRI